MLVAPKVLAPLTPWSPAVRVCGLVTGASVAIFADADQVGQAVATGPEMLVPLRAGVALRQGQLVTASQELAGVKSPPVPATSAVPVLAAPAAAQLGSIFTRSAIMECGTCLWLEGVVPGTQIEVWKDGAPQATVMADWTGVHVDLQPVSATAKVTCRQSRGTEVGPLVTLPQALPLPAGRRAEPPGVVEPLYTCQKTLSLTRVIPGAQINLSHGSDRYEFCFGAVNGTLHLARGLVSDEEILVRQGLAECGVEGVDARFTVSADVPPTPSWPHPVCRGDREVEVEGLLAGAKVQFLLGKGTGNVVTGEVAPGQRRFVLPPFGNETQLGVQQTLCGGGPWSGVAWVTLGEAGSLDHPAILEPVVACATAAGVTRLSAGTRVTVLSKLWQGPIGEAIAVGDRFTTVPLLFPAFEGDHLSLQVVRCGHQRDIGGHVRVQPAPSELPPPHLDEPLDDAGGAITVAGLTPGAICDVVLHGPHPAAAGHLIASVPVVSKRAAVPVPPLEPGLYVSCRQRLCSNVSRPSRIVVTGDITPPYVRGSADRKMALTGVNTPGGRLARYDTTKIGLSGTDLGVPVVHNGRLYLFFGDAAEELVPGKNGFFQNVKDTDPIAWTTDDAQTPGGPYLTFLTAPAGHFQPLAVDGLPAFGNFEVPTGGFSYRGRLYLFVANFKHPKDGDGQRMHRSHLAVTHQPGGVEQGFELLYHVASTLPDFPAGSSLVHLSPTVVRCADWPGLPVPSGDGVVLFGTSKYQASHLYLAFLPLRQTYVDQPVPDPAEWWVWARRAEKEAPQWIRVKDMPPAGRLKKMFKGPETQGEVSVSWIPQLRRWLAIHPGYGIVVRTARNPWGPWTDVATVFHGEDVARDATADNLVPGHRFVGLDRELPPERKTVVYAPYLIPSWTRYDPSIRLLTIYYALSTEGPPYNVQLMSAQLQYPSG